MDVVAAIKERSYSAGLTRSSGVLLGASALVACLLIWTGIDDAGRYSARDPLRIPMVFGPILFGLLVVGLSGLVASRNLGRRVQLTGKGVTVSAGARELLSGSWDDVVCVRAGRGWLQVAVINQGTRYVYLYSAFVPRFESMMKDLLLHASAGRERVRHRL